MSNEKYREYATQDSNPKSKRNSDRRRVHHHSVHEWGRNRATIPTVLPHIRTRPRCSLID